MSTVENKNEGASLQRTFSDFEPYCKWRRDEQSENLEVHLEDFKKENFKVRLSNRGILTIRGERHLGGNRYSRFHKEVKVSNDCDTDKMRAKLSRGVLYVTMPKKAPSITENKTSSFQGIESEETAKPKQEKATDDIGAREKDANQNAEKNVPVQRMNPNNKSASKIVGLLLTLLATYGAYVAYKRYISASRAKNEDKGQASKNEADSQELRPGFGSGNDNYNDRANVEPSQPGDTSPSTDPLEKLYKLITSGSSNIGPSDAQHLDKGPAMIHDTGDSASVMDMRVSETIDAEIKLWAKGKEGNLRALLSSLERVLGRECGWKPVSSTDLATFPSVREVYRKAVLCIHPDKVQQKGADVQQKYIAEMVFDILKEAWNKFKNEKPS